MAGMFVRGSQRRFAVINLLRRRTAGNSVVFDSGKATLVGRRQIRLYIVQIKIESNVAIKIAVARVAGVAFLAAPYLPRSLAVAAKRRDAFAREHWRI